MNRTRGGTAAGRPKGGQTKRGLDDEQLEELREAFNLFDADRSGVIDARELKAAIRALGFVVKKEQVRQMLRDVGRDVQSQISFEDFAKIMTTKMGDRNSREEINKIFNLFDEDSSGKVSFRNLKRIAQEIGESLKDEELQEMIDEADRDGDGLINPDEFYRVMRKRGDNPLDDFDTDDD
mmetsp:Transcript_7695/g.18590  ORF Transcript_7695/g.18590 Transcript_7695/m.18590 type:complete len:180 (-) Transcript_7695:97-636(-)|eukprot:CAMPEP_0178994316 /NCGR_PEP_ID=MMETSP0795-20121207/7207_1 /TAXON_ID=88552 /ORGANISM="Amoebophrya sp., Strain Ameob2" /LENGTH=179 /DNA_ID=CAMNT_0020686505 /DNA_START=109 /DNA_END=648 /DNA_ORIENTATION=+